MIIQDGQVVTETDDEIGDEALDLIEEICEAMNEPETDDPIDVLKQIARIIGDSNYTYFDGLGEWVCYPNAVTRTQ